MMELLIEFSAMMLGATIGAVLFGWIGEKYYKLYEEPAVARRGGTIYGYLFVLLVVWPTLHLIDAIESGRLGFVSILGASALSGALLVVPLLLADRYGLLARLPFAGRNLNAYMLSVARARRDGIEREIRRYEARDASFMGSPAGSSV